MTRDDIESLCELTGYTLNVLRIKDRTHERVLARYLVMEQLVKYGFTYTKSANVFNINYATYIHGKKVLNNIRETRYPERFYKFVKRFETNIATYVKQLKETSSVNDEFYPFIQTELLCG